MKCRATQRYGTIEPFPTYSLRPRPLSQRPPDLLSNSADWSDAVRQHEHRQRHAPQQRATDGGSGKRYGGHDEHESQVLAQNLETAAAAKTHETDDRDRDGRNLTGVIVRITTVRPP